MGSGQAAEDGLAIVTHCAGFTVHQARSANHLPTKSGADGLVSKADAQDGYFAGEVADQTDADTGFLGRAWAGRNDDVLRLHRFNIGNCELIVAANLHLCAEFAEILNQVIGK